MRDPYEVLGVAKDAGDDEIKSAYRKLAMQHHPDRNQGADTSEAFKEVNAAYEAIKDAGRRREREQGFREFRFSSGMGGGGFEDIFDMFSSQMRQRNVDIHIRVVITLEEAFHGKTTTVTYATNEGQKTATVTIPPGIDNGMRIKIAGGGARNHGSLPAGDAFVNVTVMPHHSFQRSGIALISEHAVDAFSAMLGASVTIRTVDGSDVNLTIPAGTQPNTRFRIPGRGMPNVHQPVQRGDFYVHIKVEIPILAEDEAALLRDMISKRR
jgi:curved DNA-binding protein